MTTMRKILPCVLLILLGLMLCAPASAETHVLDPIFASVEVPDSYIVLTSDNLSEYSDWLASRDMNMEDVANDFIKRGVLLQCWTAEYDACFELTAVQNDRAKTIFDVNEQSESIRRSYRTGHYPDNTLSENGYDYTASDWKNTGNGRFLVLRYTRRDSGEVLYRGFMRRTIRNGYEITLDMQIHGRSATNKDNNNLNKIWDTFRFIEIKPLTASASAKLNITTVPPAQTKEQSFDIRGTAAEGVKLTAVTMGLSYPDPILAEVTVPKNGKFTLPIKLPKEGVFLVTLTAEHMGEVVQELAYPVTYQSTLLVVNVTSAIPAVVTEDEFTISGTGEPGASIQVFVNSEAAFTKRVTSAGRFKLDIDTSEEGEYEIVLVFSKKNLADQRLTYTFSRQWTEADMIKQLRKQAVKPGYSNLVRKIEGYAGSIMGYNAYLMNVTQSGDDYILRMALNKRGDTYSNIIIVVSAEQPSFNIGDRMMMYGTCVGMSQSNQIEEGEAAENYPCFELLLLASLD